MARYEHDCPECDGEGEVVCECCGSELDCSTCKGSGMDPDIYDMKAIQQATHGLHELAKNNGSSFLSYAWVENGVYIGRKNDFGRFRYSEFLRK